MGWWVWALVEQIVRGISWLLEQLIAIEQIVAVSTSIYHHIHPDSGYPEAA